MTSAPAVSLVVICHEMARELPRTLLSLSPGYQRGAERLRWEVIVVDNGSANPPHAEQFEGLDLDVTVHRYPEPTPSPAATVNYGLARARAPLVGVWIDGARLASPGLLAACHAAARLHPRAVVATFGYHLGPDIQHRSMQQGYDAAAEDRLLASIDWPRGADRLREIATPCWSGGEAGPLLESNALFLSAALWEELAGYDTRFRGPGGGAVNPDVFLRACAAPGTQLIRVAGEGTFHQIHGGTTTSAGSRSSDMLKLGSKQYWRLRGRPMLMVRERGWIYDHRTGAVR